MKQYYQPLDEEALVTGAIRGMTKAVGDVYTFYYTPEEMQRENEDEQGRYHGIGVLIERSDEGYIEIVRVFPESPAELVGMKVGDLIYSVDGELVGGLRGKNYEDGVKDIRGEENTTVRLGILRDKETFEVDVMRADVNISYASYQLLEDDIGYVSISQFTGDAADRFDEALGYFKGHNAKGMIIDLRSNPGGLLTEVNRIADRILPKGIIVYIQDRNGVRTDYYSDAEMYDIPVVVLVNDMSASASEILAASVQALDRGTVVGVRPTARAWCRPSRPSRRTARACSTPPPATSTPTGAPSTAWASPRTSRSRWRPTASPSTPTPPATISSRRR